MKKNMPDMQAIQNRKMVHINRQANKAINPQLSTAVHTRETKKRSSTSTSLAFANLETKKQIPLFAHNVLPEYDSKIPYSRMQMNHLKSMEPHFLVPGSYDKTTLFTMCRFKFVLSLRKAKEIYGLLEETVFLAIHIYDKYFMEEESMKKELNKIKTPKEHISVTKFMKADISPPSSKLREMDNIANTVLFIAAKYQEIYPPDLHAMADKCSTSAERMIELEAEVLAVLEYNIQPTIELSIIEILKAELDFKIQDALKRSETLIRLGVYTGILRESNIVSTIFGMVLIHSKHLASSLSDKCKKLLMRYEVDEEKARLDFNIFYRLLSAFRSEFKELSDLMSN